MKYLSRIFYLSLCFSVLIACSEDEFSEMNELSDMSDPTLKYSAQNVNPPEFYCNQQSVVFDLITAQEMNAGVVTIVNDDKNIYITLQAAEGLSFKQLRIYAGSKEGVPLNKMGIPLSMRFPYKAWKLETQTYTQAIPLDKIDGECPLILVNVILNTGEAAWAWENQDESFTFESYFGVSRWGYLGDYCIEDCSEDMMFTMKFWFERPDGSTSWCALEAPEQFYFQDDWCDRMGVIRLTRDTVLNVMRWTEHFGVAQIEISGESVRVNITADDPDNKIYRTHVFYGTLPELWDYGSCPDFLSFPYIFEDAGAASFEISLD